MTKAKEIEREVIENIEMERLLSVLRFKGEIELKAKEFNIFWKYICNNYLQELKDDKIIPSPSKKDLYGMTMRYYPKGYNN